MGLNALSNAEKVAILLLALGEEIAAEILGQMNELEVKRVTTIMARLGRVEKEVVNGVIEEFHGFLAAPIAKGLKGDGGNVRGIIAKAFNGETAGRLVEELALDSSNLEILEVYDAESLSNTIRNEHPQTIAVILAHLDPKKCGATLSRLPESLQLEVVNRIAKLGSIAPMIIDEIDSFLRQEAERMGGAKYRKLGGTKKVADILSALDKDSEQTLLDGIADRDPDLAENIRDKMFVFDDLVNLDSKSVQLLTKNIPNATLKLALRKAPEEVLELFFSNMSERAAKILKEDIESMGPVRVSDINRARGQILKIAKELEAKGQIVFKGKEEYV